MWITYSKVMTRFCKILNASSSDSECPNIVFQTDDPTFRFSVFPLSIAPSIPFTSDPIIFIIHRWRHFSRTCRDRQTSRYGISRFPLTNAFLYINIVIQLHR